MNARTPAARAEAPHGSGNGAAFSADEVPSAALEHSTTEFAAERKAARRTDVLPFSANNVLKQKHGSSPCQSLPDLLLDVGEKRVLSLPVPAKDTTGERRERTRYRDALRSERLKISRGKRTQESHRNAKRPGAEQRRDARIVTGVEIPLSMGRER
jgi:hypothetical protein